MSPAKEKAADLAGTLETARRDLLDLGLRNTLLNYRRLFMIAAITRHLDAMRREGILAPRGENLILASQC